MSLPASFTIRRATIDDYHSLCELFAKLDALHVDLLPQMFHEFSGPARPLELFREKVTGPDKTIFVAVVSDRVVAFADVMKTPNPPFPMFRPGNTGKVDNVFVLDEFRRLGIAHALFEHVKEWAKELGLSSIQLHVYNANQEAVRFYKKEGMEPVSTKFELNLKTCSRDTICGVK